MKFYLAFFTVLFLVAGIDIRPLQAQLKRHDNLEARFTTHVQQDKNYYSYVFSIANETSSIQQLETIRIEIGDIGNNKGGTISKLTQIVTEGNKWTGWTSDAKAKPGNENAKGLVLWVADYDSIKNTSDMFAPPESALRPGESQQFSITSNGLPRIMRFWVRGFTEPYTVSEYDSLRHIVGLTADEVSPPWYEDAFQGRTIAPVLPQNSFNHLNFLDSLRGYIPQSQSLNWLGDASFASQLEDQLQQVRSELVAGDSAQAAATLSGFIGLVEAVNAGTGPAGSSLTSEGYALLYFNGEYLLDRLPEPQALSVIPGLPAALTISSAQASGAFSGDNFTISGINHTVEGNPAGSGPDVNGILTTTTAGRQGILNGLQAYQQDNITGAGSPPDIVTGTLDFNTQALIDSVLAHIDQTIPANASGSYGSLEEPVVIHADQGIQSSGTITGYGILLVDGPLQISGTMGWTGLVVQRGMPSGGPATSVSTSLTITGGMLVVNEGPFGASLQVSNELIVRTSGEALQALRDHLEF